MRHSPQQPVDQDRRSAPAKKSFADETPAQKAKHHEIAVRHRWNGRRKPKFPNFRKRDLEKIFFDRWGATLPDDDAGMDDFLLMADHLAHFGPLHITRWAQVWSPWMTPERLAIAIENVGAGQYWQADKLGKKLNLKDVTRTRLKIGTIGAADFSKAQRKKRRSKQKAAREATRRAKDGAASHRLSKSRLKPWIEAGMSRTSYYRELRSVRTNSCPPVGTHSCPPAPGFGTVSCPPIFLPLLGTKLSQIGECGAAARSTDAADIAEPLKSLERTAVAAQVETVVALEMAAPTVAGAAAGDGEAIRPPRGFSEARFQTLRDIFPNPEDEA